MSAQDWANAFKAVKARRKLKTHWRRANVRLQYGNGASEAELNRAQDRLLWGLADDEPWQLPAVRGSHGRSR